MPGGPGGRRGGSQGAGAVGEGTGQATRGSVGPGRTWASTPREMGALKGCGEVAVPLRLKWLGRLDAECWHPPGSVGALPTEDACPRPTEMAVVTTLYRAERRWGPACGAPTPALPLVRKWTFLSLSFPTCKMENGQPRHGRLRPGRSRRVGGRWLTGLRVPRVLQALHWQSRPLLRVGPRRLLCLPQPRHQVRGGGRLGAGCLTCLSGAPSPPTPGLHERGFC